MIMLFDAFIPILYFLLGGIVFVLIMQTISKLTRPKGKQSEIKQSVYECGEIPTTENVRQQFNYQYYIYAIVFAGLDVLSIVTYSWATSNNKLSANTLLIFSVFTGVLILAFIYVAITTIKWKKTVL